MDKWRCIPWDYIYDPARGDEEGGIAPGTASKNLPDDWECPICGVCMDLKMVDAMGGRQPTGSHLPEVFLGWGWCHFDGTLRSSLTHFPRNRKCWFINPADLASP